MQKSRSFAALLAGIRYCLLEPSTRKFALIPWAVGLLSYAAIAYAAVLAHPYVVDLFISDSSGFWNSILYWLAWAGSALLLTAAVLVLSFVLVFVATSALLGNLAEAVLKLEGLEKPARKAGLVGEAKRAVALEARKLLVLLPLGASVFLMALIPPLVPFSIAIAAWTLAFESLDPTFELFTLPFAQRFSFAKENWMAMTLFGLSLTAVGLIPLAGVFLPPIAVAGGAWLMAPNSEDLGAVKKPA